MLIYIYIYIFPKSLNRIYQSIETSLEVQHLQAAVVHARPPETDMWREWSCESPGKGGVGGSILDFHEDFIIFICR